jgi:hypothetical protein
MVAVVEEHRWLRTPFATLVAHLLEDVGDGPLPIGQAAKRADVDDDSGAGMRCGQVSHQLECQAALSDAGRADQGEQPSLVEAVEELDDFEIPPDQRR